MNDTSSTTTNVTAALRQAAEFIDAHPELPEPYLVLSCGAVELNYYLTIDFKDADAHAQKAAAQAIIRAVPGKWDKSTFGPSSMRFQASLTANLKFDVHVSREAVCERVVTGTETVTIPAVAAVEAQPERTEARDVVEWRCLPLLAEAVPA